MGTTEASEPQRLGTVRPRWHLHAWVVGSFIAATALGVLALLWQ